MTMRKELYRNTEYYLCIGKPSPSTLMIGVGKKGVPGWFHRKTLRVLLGIYVVREDYIFYEDGGETTQTIIK